MAIAEFLEHGAYDAHLRKTGAFFASQLQRFSGSVARYFPSGVRVSRPQGGFVLWIEFDLGVDTTELAALALNKYRIAVAPGCIFSATGENFHNCLRISCGHPWSPQVENALETLGKLAGERERNVSTFSAY